MKDDRGPRHNEMGIVILGLFIISLPLIPSLLFSGGGETGATFLTLDAGAKSIGMGGASTALATGVQTLFWNPGALGWLNGKEATVMHTEHFQAIKYENIGFAMGKNKTGIGIAIKGLFVGGMEERSKPSANPVSSFGACFLAPSLGLAKPLNSNFSLGLNFKPVYQKIKKTVAFSIAADLGMSIRTGSKGPRFGLAFLDFGSRVKFLSESYALPTRIRAGLAYSLFNENLSLGFDIVRPLKADMEYAVGIENVIMKTLLLRLGYRRGFHNSSDWGGLTAGAGFKIQDIDIDYAFANNRLLSMTHSFSLSYIFGRSLEISQETEQKIVEEFQKRSKTNAERFYTQAVEKEKAGKYDEGLWSYNLSLAWVPDYKEAASGLKNLEKKKVDEHLSKGYGFYKEGLYLEAISEFGLAVNLDSTNKTATGWLKAAIAALVKSHKEKGMADNLLYYLKLGLEQYAKREYLQAIGQWQKALAISPDQTELANYIARAQSDEKRMVEFWVAKRRWRQASNSLDQLLAFNPDDSLLLAKKEEVKKNLNSLIREHNKNGMAFFNQGRYHLALIEFKSVQNLDIDNLVAKHHLAKIEAREKKPVSKTDIIALYEQAVNAFTEQNYEQAIYYWQGILDLDPTNFNAQENIARAEKLRR